MRKEPEIKASVLKFLIFIVIGIFITGHCIHLLTQYYITDEITFYIGDMQIYNREALVSTITFFTAGILFIIYGILEFHRLTQASRYLRMIAIVLLTIIIGLTGYFAIEYYNFVKEDLRYALLEPTIYSTSLFLNS